MQKLENVLKEIESVGNIQFSSYTKPLIAVEDVIKIIRAHIPLENDAEIKRSSRDNDGWISVEERLPEGRTRVICQFDNGDIELLWQDWESDLRALTYLTDFDFMAEKKVIAWRPLPEPYRPERR